MNSTILFIEMLVGLLAVLLYMVEARKAKIRRARALKARALKLRANKIAQLQMMDHTKEYPIVVDTVEKATVYEVAPLTVNEMVGLIEDNVDKLDITHYQTLRVAYGIEKVPFEVNLKDSLQWVCEQLGLTSTIGDESYLIN